MKQKIIIVVGPTASGKSDLTFEIAKKINANIIVCDAFQVYKQLNIGVNKPDYEQLNLIKHYLINEISIFDDWNIKIFQTKVNSILKNNKQIFILEGGSNLYIDCLIKNYNLNPINFNFDFDKFSNLQLYNYLKKIDYEESLKVNINNRKRIIQAIKIIKSNHIKKSLTDKMNLNPIYDYFLIYKKAQRSILYEKINLRTLAMLNKGWKKEVVDLIKIHGKNIINLNAFKAIGYSIIYDAVINNKEINTSLIQQQTRNYAKRQITWIKNKFNPHFIYENETQFDLLIKNINEFLKN